MLYMKEMRAKVVAECTLKESAAINQILGRRVSGAQKGQNSCFSCIYQNTTVYINSILHFILLSGCIIYTKGALWSRWMPSLQKVMS